MGDSTHDKVIQRDLMGKASQVSRCPLPEHLPRNQNLSVYCLLYYTLLTLQGAIPNHLSLEKVNRAPTGLLHMKGMFQLKSL